MKVGPVAIVNGRFGNRSHCIYRGFCLQGCKVNAKASPLITHVPDALAHGAEIRADSMVTKIAVGIDGRTNGVTYLHAGVEYHQRTDVYKRQTLIHTSIGPSASSSRVAPAFTWSKSDVSASTANASPPAC